MKAKENKKTENLDLVLKHDTERQKFSISSWSMRPKDRNTWSRLEARNHKTEILDLVLKHETERQKSSISSWELKNASRYGLVQGDMRITISSFWMNVKVTSDAGADYDEEECDDDDDYNEDGHDV